jgi:hypothetical protein
MSTGGTLNPPAGISFVNSRSELTPVYAENCLVLLPRSPRNIFTYWDICQDIAPEYQRVLRVYRESTPEVVLQQEIIIHREAYNWYIQIPATGGLYFTQLGHLIEGKFIPWLTSNRVIAPLAEISAKIDPSWSPLVLPNHSSERNTGTSWFT